MKKERINSIDSLKGIACCVIAFLWHYLNMQGKSMGMPLQSVFGIFYDYGQYFVELFFMISGFVMAYCYREKIANGEDFFSYIKKRYQHLYPLFFTTLMVMVAMEYLYHLLTGSYYVYKVSVWHLILNLLCIQTGWLTTDQSFNGPAWCISVEIFLYVLYYITTRYTRNDKNAYTIVNAILFVNAVIFVYKAPFDLPMFNQFMLRGVACFYAGALLCEINERMGRDKKESLAWKSLILFVLFRICLLFTEYSFWETEKYGQLGLILLEWPIVLFAAINWKPLRKILEVNPLIKLGSISMDIFLWHIPVQITIKTIDNIFNLRIDYGKVYIWFIYIISVVIVSMISYAVGKRGRKNYFWKVIITLICCIMAFVITNTLGIRMSPSLNNSLSYSDSAGTVMMKQGTVLGEDFYVEKDTRLRKIQFYAITWNKAFTEDQEIEISIYDKTDEKRIYSGIRKLSTIKDGSTCDVNISEEISLRGNHWYTVEFTTNTSENEEAMAFMFINSSDNVGECYVNGDVSAKHIAVKVYTKK